MWRYLHPTRSICSAIVFYFYFHGLLALGTNYPRMNRTNLHQIMRIGWRSSVRYSFSGHSNNISMVTNFWADSATLVYPIFSARCNIYFSRLCYDVSVRLSVRLSVTFVHCGHRVQYIPDTFACLDRWISVLLTDNTSPGWDNAGISGGKGEGSSRAILATVRPSYHLSNWHSKMDWTVTIATPM